MATPVGTTNAAVRDAFLRGRSHASRGTRLRVLVGAYACHPFRGSEPGVGWTWVRGLAEHVELDVVTADHEGSRVAITEVLAGERALGERLRFHFLPDFVETAWRRHPFLLKYYQPLYYRYYRRWMQSACELARNLDKRRPFDLVHQLTMIGYREPGYLWRLPRPFVWGPIGGTQDVPWRFLPSLGALEASRHAARNTMNAWQFRRDERFRAALDRARGVICTASDTADRMRRVHGRESQVIPASFAPAPHPLGRVRRRTTGPLRLVFSGLQVSRKGLPLALRALASLERELPWRLDVLGAGVMGDAWRREAAALGIAEAVTWHGQRSRDEAIGVMAAADVFLFPSLQEGSPAVVVEALALGLPVVALRHHGTADYVDASSGVLVEVESPAQVVGDLARAVRGLIASDEDLSRLSRGALERARQFSAPMQVPRILQVYEGALALS